MPNVRVDELRAEPMQRQPIEVVERKGLGHPDSICDGVAEHISLALTQAYCEQFGSVLHYNVDKGLLAAGSVEHRFAGGQVLEPMQLVIGDRATFEADGIRIPVADIVQDAARDWFRHHLARIDPERHLRVRVALHPSSPELAAIFRRQSGLMPANDTSALVGYAPLSQTERIVLGTERYLNSAAFKADFPDTGQDVKVLGIRRGTEVTLTVAMPLLGRQVASEATYFRRKSQVEDAPPRDRC